MAKITDYLQISDALDADRLKPLQFREAVFNQFKSETDGLRETYLDNQRVPEELSKTRLNNRTNQFKTDDLNQNYGDLLTTSRNRVRFGVGDSQFKLDNQDASQDLTLAQQQESLASTRNRVLDANADSEATELLRNNPPDPSQDPRDYYTNLMGRASSPQVRKRIATEARTRFVSQLNSVSSFVTQLERVERSTDTRRASENNRLNNMIKRTDFETLEFLRSNGIMTPQQEADYDGMIDIIMGTGDAELIGLINPSPQQDVPASPQQTSPVIEQPSAPTALPPEELDITSAQVATPIVDTDPADLVNPVIDPTVPLIDPTNNVAFGSLRGPFKLKAEILTQPLTIDNYEEVDTAMGDLGPELLNLLGISEQDILTITNQIKEYEEVDITRNEQITTSDRVIVSQIQSMAPDLVEAFSTNEEMTPELLLRQKQLFDEFTESGPPNEQGVRLQMLEEAGINIKRFLDTVEESKRRENSTLELVKERIQLDPMTMGVVKRILTSEELTSEQKLAAVSRQIGGVGDFTTTGITSGVTTQDNVEDLLELIEELESNQNG